MGKQNRIAPCNCEDGSEKSTYIRMNLNGRIRLIKCIECNDHLYEEDCLDIVKEWNKKKRESVNGKH